MAFGNLVISTVSSTYGNVSSIAVSRLNEYIQRVINGNSTKVTFVYDGERTFIQSLVDSAFMSVSAGLVGAAKDLIFQREKKRKAQEEERTRILEEYKKSRRYTDLIHKGEKQQNTDISTSTYGKMVVTDINGGEHAVICRDYMGYFCTDGLMLKTPSKKPIKYDMHTQPERTEEANKISLTEDGVYSAKYLVWSDCTALVSINSDRNLILTKVAGRDYSRKELVSNGDINFSVSGHILSGIAEVYPEEKVKKFIQTMRYKGIVEVNNIILDQFNISKIVIKDFSLSPVEGDKSRQDYTFNAVGIQPDSEVQVDEDTLYLDTYIKTTETNEAESKWAKFMKAAAQGAVQSLEETVDNLGAQGINGIINTYNSNVKI